MAYTIMIMLISVYAAPTTPPSNNAASSTPPSSISTPPSSSDDIKREQLRQFLIQQMGQCTGEECKALHKLIDHTLDQDPILNGRMKLPENKPSPQPDDHRILHDEL